MTTRNRSLSMALLGSLAGGMMACAHAQPSGEAQANRKAAAPEKVFVTGSHIAQRVDPKTGVPLTVSPVQFYNRDQLLGTGRSGDLRAALGTLDPGLSP
jgi:hypothetical protein